MLFPLAAVFAMAFFRGDFMTHAGPEGLRVEADWHGWENFSRLLADPRFHKALWNTLYLMLAIPVGMVGSLGLALLLNQKLPGRIFFRTVFFFPTVSSGVALFLVWRWIYNPEFGLFNGLLSQLGIAAPAWLTDPAWTKPAIMIMLLWITMGGPNMILYLAGLGQIDPALHEAARLDGAGRWGRFWHVTLPMLSPTTFFILTTNVILGFQLFDPVYIMTPGGGPQESSSTMVYFLFDRISKSADWGYAAAIAVAVFALTLGFTLLNAWLGKRLVHY